MKNDLTLCGIVEISCNSVVSAKNEPLIVVIRFGAAFGLTDAK